MVSAAVKAGSFTVSISPWLSLLLVRMVIPDTCRRLRKVLAIIVATEMVVMVGMVAEVMKIIMAVMVEVVVVVLRV